MGEEGGLVLHRREVAAIFEGDTPAVRSLSQALVSQHHQPSATYATVHPVMQGSGEDVSSLGCGSVKSLG